MDDYILEVCTDSVESACIAEQGGANRIELCSNLIIGGTTPSLALFEEVRKRVSIKIHVLIRPRFGDFLYTDAEFDIIKREVELFRNAKADGVVIGILKPDGTLDMDRMKVLMDLAREMSVTLHRAFDVSKDAFQSLDAAKELGIHTILTSGQQADCVSGKALLADLVKRANGKLDILAAGGISAQVIEEVFDDIRTTSYHMSGKVTLNSLMKFRRKGVPMGLPGISEYEIWRTDLEKIRSAQTTLKRKIMGFS